MTANELATELELRVDRSSAFGAPSYEDFDISSVLTEAQWFAVKKIIDPRNNNKLKGAESSEWRVQELSPLTTNATLTASSSQVGVLTNGQFFDLPSNFMYTLHEEVTIDKSYCYKTGSMVLPVFVVGHNELERFRTNKYKKPFQDGYTGRVLRLGYSRFVDGSTATATPKRHEIITDGTFAVTGYRLRYFKQPPAIVVNRVTPASQVNCILDEAFQETILDIATNILMERVKEQRTLNQEPSKELT